MRKRVSIVLHVVDWYSGKAAKGSELRILVDGMKVNYVYKEEGFFVLTDIAEGKRNLQIEAVQFLTHQCQVEVDNRAVKVPILEVELKPSRMYPFGNMPTTVMGKIHGIADKKNQNASVYLYLQADGVKIAEDDVIPGRRDLKLYMTKDRSQIRGKYIIKNKDIGCREYCDVVDGPDDQGLYTLASPVTNKHTRGTVLYPVVPLTLQEDGSFFEVLKGVGEGEMEMFLRIEKGQNQGEEKVFCIKSGTRNELGVIQA